MRKKKRRIAVMIGSDSDLAQCSSGLFYLRDEERLCEVVAVITNSIHRNTRQVLNNLEELSCKKVDVLIVGAGWANHLTGTCDAYLRNTLRNKRMVVVGVAFQGTPQRTQTAVLSITEVPGTQVVFDNYVGPDGFRAACEYAVRVETLPAIMLPKPRPVVIRTISKAYTKARELAERRIE